MAESGNLRLYVVLRYGNEAEAEELGANGADTIFLVRARDHIRAAELADRELRNSLPHSQLPRWCYGAYEVGVSHTITLPQEYHEMVLFGPVVPPTYATGGCPCWIRHDEKRPWIFQGDCPGCGFRLDEADTEPKCPKCGWCRTERTSGRP